MRIFVSIAAYRDPELEHTLRDLFARARVPERLRVVVCDQFGPEATEFPDDLRENPSIERIAVPWEQSRGACWARALIQSRYQGEEYYLQLDSHHRFVDGWDEVLLEEIVATGREKAVLTGYVNAYVPGQPLDDSEGPLSLDFDAFHANGIAVFRPTILDDRFDRSRPRRARFVSGHFIFSQGAFVREVPYDGHLYFIGEEISLSVRAFMEGWYLYHPSRVVLWHEYSRAYRTNKHWTDHVDGKVQRPWQHADLQSRESVSRFLHDRDARGSVRSMRDYENYAGICFARQRVHPKTLECVEPPLNLPEGWEALGARYVFDICVPLQAEEERERVEFWVVTVFDCAGEQLFRRTLYWDDLAPMQRTPVGFLLPIAFDAESQPTAWTMVPVAHPDADQVRFEGNIARATPAKQTFVTAIVDLGRDQLTPPRPYSEYRERLAELLGDALRDVNVVVWCDSEDAEFVRKLRGEAPTEIRHLSRAELVRCEIFEQIERLRVSKDWFGQAKWLESSPQAALPGYVSLVCKKFELLRAVAIDREPTHEVFWVDAGLSRTVRPESIRDLAYGTPADGLRFFAYPYDPETAEIHGFAREGIDRFASRPVVRVLRGGFFGGAASLVLSAADRFEELLRLTLAAGYLGTEESIFSILHARGEPEFERVVEISENGLIPSAPAGRVAHEVELPGTVDRIATTREIRRIVGIDRRAAPAFVVCVGPNAWAHATLVAPWLAIGDILEVRPAGVADATMAFVTPSDIERSFADFELVSGRAHRLVRSDGAPRQLPSPNATREAVVYVLSYNTPVQFAAWLENVAATLGASFLESRRVLINNSTDASTFAEYDALCERFGIDQVRFENLGITGGRLAAIRHFIEQTTADQMWYFEDDMFVSNLPGTCRNGFATRVDDLFDVVTDIVAEEPGLDMLKLSFSEYFGCHQLDWAWVNSSPEERAAFAGGSATSFRTIRSTRGLAFALGDVHYSHWPAVLTRRGAATLVASESPRSETEMMRLVHRLQLDRRFSSGVLLASPIVHTRVSSYQAASRRES